MLAKVTCSQSGCSADLCPNPSKLSLERTLGELLTWFLSLKVYDCSFSSSCFIALNIFFINKSTVQKVVNTVNVWCIEFKKIEASVLRS